MLVGVWVVLAWVVLVWVGITVGVGRGVGAVSGVGITVGVVGRGVVDGVWVVLLCLGVGGCLSCVSVGGHHCIAQPERPLYRSIYCIQVERYRLLFPSIIAHVVCTWSNNHAHFRRHQDRLFAHLCPYVVLRVLSRKYLAKCNNVVST